MVHASATTPCQEAMMQKFPQLIMEGCSGSGHMKDFGDIQRVHMIAMNDTLSSLPNRQGTYDSTFALSARGINELHLRKFYDTVSDAPEPYFLAIFHDECVAD